MKRFATIFLMICAVLAGSLTAGTSQKASWSLSAEFGSGHMLGLTFARILPKSFEAGLGTGFDLSSERIGDADYTLFLMNASLLGSWHMLRKDSLDLLLRLQAGEDFLFAGKKYSTAAFDLTPAFQAGYKNIYAVVSGVCIFTKKFAFVPQLGIGYRFEF